MTEPRAINPTHHSARHRAGDAGAVIPRWISPTLIERTTILFSRLYNRIVSRDEAVTILSDVGRLLDALVVRGKAS